MGDMSAPVGKEERQGLLRRFLSGLRFPQLFLLLVALFTVDLIAPDPILFVDEAILGILATMLGLWRHRGRDEPEMKNITPERSEP